MDQLNINAVPSEPVVLISRKAQHKTASSIPSQEGVGGYVH